MASIVWMAFATVLKLFKNVGGASYTNMVLNEADKHMASIVWMAIATMLKLFKNVSGASCTNMVLNEAELKLKPRSVSAVFISSVDVGT